MPKPLTGPELEDLRKTWSSLSASRQPLPPALRDRAARDISRLLDTITAAAAELDGLKVNDRAPTTACRYGRPDDWPCRCERHADDCLCCAESHAAETMTEKEPANAA
jgi:hypothetical protein